MTDVHPQCQTCRFWQPLDPLGDGFAADRNYEVTDDGEGICRRHPPVGQRRDFLGGRSAEPGTFTHSTDAALWAQWPVTSGDIDWCGEHSSRQEAA